MIEQKAIYEAAQTAFEAHHPKFPWPKKHNLDEQTDEFKKAFLVFSTDINAMHDKEMQSLVLETNAFRDRLTVEINAASTARENARVANRRAEKFEARLASANTSATLGWCVAALAIFVLILVALN